jgi:alpha-glucosidase
MPWDAQTPDMGFGSATPWLPLVPEHRALAVAEQSAGPDSTLNVARRFLALRKNSPELRWGEMTFWDAPAPVLAFERNLENTSVFCAFNMSGERCTLSDSRLPGMQALDSGTAGGRRSGECLALAPFGVWLARR